MKILFFILICASAFGQSGTLKINYTDNVYVLPEISCLVNHMGEPCDWRLSVDFKGVAKEESRNTDEELMLQIMKLKEKISEIEGLMNELCRQITTPPGKRKKIE